MALYNHPQPLNTASLSDLDTAVRLILSSFLSSFFFLSPPPIVLLFSPSPPPHTAKNPSSIAITFELDFPSLIITLCVSLVELRLGGNGDGGTIAAKQTGQRKHWFRESGSDNRTARYRYGREIIKTLGFYRVKPPSCPWLILRDAIFGLSDGLRIDPCTNRCRAVL